MGNGFPNRVPMFWASVLLAMLTGIDTRAPLPGAASCLPGCGGGTRNGVATQRRHPERVRRRGRVGQTSCLSPRTFQNTGRRDRQDACPAFPVEAAIPRTAIERRCGAGRAFRPRRFPGATGDDASGCKPACRNARTRSGSPVPGATCGGLGRHGIPSSTPRRSLTPTQ